MALGYAVKNRIAFGNVQARLVDVTLDGSYAAGGYLLATGVAGVGLARIDHVVPVQGQGGLVFEWISSTGKLKAWKGAGSAVLTEAASGDMSSSNVVRCLVLEFQNAVP